MIFGKRNPPAPGRTGTEAVSHLIGGAWFLQASLGWLMAAHPVAHAEQISLPAEESVTVVGKVQNVTAREEETLLDIARRHGLGYHDIRLANFHLNAWLPGGGAQVTLPSHYVLPRARHRGVVLNIPEMRLYYYPKSRGNAQERQLWTYPIGIGREGWSIPYVQTSISAKRKDPGWTPPESIRQEHLLIGDPLPKYVPPGPDNPLGAYALRLTLPGYLIHGTNKPAGIGMRVSHGCIRMYPEDIQEFFSLIPVGTPVNILNQPIKAGLQHGTIYLEVHPTLSEHATGTEAYFSEALLLFEELSGGRGYQADMELMERVLLEARGVPIAVGALLDVRLEQEKDEA